MQNNAVIGVELDQVLSQSQINADVEALLVDTLDTVKLVQQEIQPQEEGLGFMTFNSLVCFLCGLVVGALSGMVLILYLVKNEKIGKKMQKPKDGFGKLEFDNLNKYA